MTVKQSRIILIIITVTVVLASPIGFRLYERKKVRRITEPSILDQTHTITHVAGMIDGIEYTNSLEAFEYNYQRGARYIEIDFILTADDEVVCCHDFFDSEKYGDFDVNSVPTIDQFLETRVYGRYTTMSLVDIFALMTKYEDVYIITDVKDIKKIMRDICLKRL